jgi:hypothetical protein
MQFFLKGNRNELPIIPKKTPVTTWEQFPRQEAFLQGIPITTQV